MERRDHRRNCGQHSRGAAASPTALSGRGGQVDAVSREHARSRSRAKILREGQPRINLDATHCANL
jgi:hypothetical protein